MASSGRGSSAQAVVAAVGAPVRTPVEQLGPGQREDQDRQAARPVEEVVDEVEQAGIGPLEVLEHEHDRAALGDALEEDPPGREQRLAPAGRRLIDAEQASSAGSIRSRSLASGTYSSSVAAIRSRVVASSSSSVRPARRRTISPSAQNVTPSPYDGDRPRCQ